MGSEAQNQRRSALRRSRNRTAPKPFSDCTNTISQPRSSPLTAVPSKPKPHFRPQNQANPTTISSVTVTATADADNASEPSTPLPPPRNSSPSGGDDDDGALECHTVYSRRQTANKRKGGEEKVAVPFSSYSADRAVNDGNKRNKYEVGLWEACTVPLMKKHRRAQPKQDASESSLQDYIQQQRAYFHEVDAFELPEEEIDSGNELD